MINPFVHKNFSGTITLKCQTNVAPRLPQFSPPDFVWTPRLLVLIFFICIKVLVKSKASKAATLDNGVLQL